MTMAKSTCYLHKKAIEGDSKKKDGSKGRGGDVKGRSKTRNALEPDEEVAGNDCRARYTKTEFVGRDEVSSVVAESLNKARNFK